MKRRVVFCTEFGGNYGHLSGFFPLYQQLIKEGCEVVFLLRSLQFVSLFEGCVSLQAPVPNINPVGHDSYTYGEMIAQFGYSDAQVLTNYMTDWCALLSGLKVDLLIADHAPTALLAARVMRLPSVAMGTGFVLPPVDKSFPPYLPEFAVGDINGDVQLLSVINGALNRLQARPITRLGEIFSGAMELLCTLPELDHYDTRQNADYWGPVFSDQMGVPYSWPENFQNKIFAYITSRINSLDQVLDAISTLSGFKLLHIPNASHHLISRYETECVKILAEPIKMSGVLNEASMVISQGGAGMTAQCMLAGVRHVMIPTQMEQHMMTKKMVRQGLAYGARPDSSAEEYMKIFNRALQCSLLSKNLSFVKAKYTGFSQQEQVEAMADEILSL